MLKLNLRRFAVAVLSAAVGLSSAVSVAQPTPRTAPPRKDTTRSNDEKPAADSRAGGALSVDADPIEGAEVIDRADIDAEATDGDLEPRVGITRPGAAVDLDEDALKAAFSGMVTGVSADRITVQLGPPRVPIATEQVFKVSTRTPVMINGQKAQLAGVKKGQFVRIITMPGDPEAAARIVVATPPSARNGNARTVKTPGTPQNRPPRSEPAVAVTPPPLSEDEDPHFDVFPDKDSAPAKRGPQGEQSGAPVRERMVQGDEEAVLPLGIEVYGPGEGALVTEMLAQGPASRSGVQIGDFLTQVNHKPVGDPENIEQLMADTANENGAVVLTLMRNGEQLEVTVEPDQLAEGSLTNQTAIAAALEPLGITVPVGRIATPAVGGGVLPGAVTTGAVAPAAVFPLGGTVSDFAGGGALLSGQSGQLIGGLQPNDVITSANGQPIRTGDDLIRALKSGAGDFALTVNRNGQVGTINVPRSAFIQAATQRTGAQRATGTLSGTTATTESGPLQRATGTLNGVVGTDQGVRDALNPNNNIAPRGRQQQRITPQNNGINPAVRGAAAQNAAARAAAAQGNAAATGTGITGGAATGGAATGGTATGGAATGGAATGGTTANPR
jgi:membrane-associated protease RseP (regulator of RpoE activity)